MIPPSLWDLALLLALTGFSLLAYSLRVLDARGAAVSFVLGFVIVYAGGLGWLLLMAVFTGMAFLATRAGQERKRRMGLLESPDGERSMANVIGNGAAPALAAVAALWLDPVAAQLAFATAVAAIAADTMGSEIGCLSPRARLVLPPFARRPAGENGAVSLLGQVSALLGAGAIAVAAVVLMDIAWAWAWIPAVGGFLGSQLDSVLGATLERDARRSDRPLSKQDVNFLASFTPAAVALVVLQLAQG